MVLSFLLVFFGVRKYRDTVGGGAIGFGKAFQVGLLISLVTCAMYVVGWEITYFNFFPHFLDGYNAHVLANLRAGGASEAAIQAKAVQLAELRQALPEPALQLRDHLPGGLPGRPHRDPGLRRDPAPEVPPRGAHVGGAGGAGLKVLSSPLSSRARRSLPLRRR